MSEEKVLKSKLSKLENKLKEIEKRNKKKKWNSTKYRKYVLIRMVPCFFTVGISAKMWPYYMNAKAYSLSTKHHVETLYDSVEPSFKGKFEWDDTKDTVDDSLIYSYGKWTLEDGSYQRNLKVYSTSNIENIDMESLFQNKSLDLEELFGNPIQDKTQYATRTLTEEELEMENYLEAFVYTIDDDKMIPYVLTIKDWIKSSPLLLAETLLINAEGVLFSILFDRLSKKKKEKILSELNLEDESKLQNNITELKLKIDKLH